MLNGCVAKAWPPTSCSTAVLAPGKYSSIWCTFALLHVHLPFSSHTSRYHAPVPELDAKRAMRVVRSRLRLSIDDNFKVGHRFDLRNTAANLYICLYVYMYIYIYIYICTHPVLSLFPFRLD